MKAKTMKARKPGTVKLMPETLVFNIGQAIYRLEVLRPDPLVAVAGFRVHKDGGAAYDIGVFPWGVECSCPDFVFRGHVKGKCKHIHRLQSLLQALAPLASR